MPEQGSPEGSPLMRIILIIAIVIVHVRMSPMRLRQAVNYPRSLTGRSRARLGAPMLPMCLLDRVPADSRVLNEGQRLPEFEEVLISRFQHPQLQAAHEFGTDHMF